METKRGTRQRGGSSIATQCVKKNNTQQVNWPTRYAAFLTLESVIIIISKESLECIIRHRPLALSPDDGNLTPAMTRGRPSIPDGAFSRRLSGIAGTQSFPGPPFPSGGAQGGIGPRARKRGFPRR